MRGGARGAGRGTRSRETMREAGRPEAGRRPAPRVPHTFLPGPVAARAFGVALLALPALLACRPEPQPQQVGWSPGGTGNVVRTSTLVPGPKGADFAARNPYADDERAKADGRALYEGFNCAGCHGSTGGGGIGPPFADADWIYGDQPENIFQSVAQGRPNGMPSFGGKIPEESLWKIVAYVRSLSPTAGQPAAALEGKTQAR